MKKILLAACFALASTAMQAQVWLGGSLGLYFQSADDNFHNRTRNWLQT